MSKIDAADQIKFLVACIGNTTNDRPDFTAVAKELSIVSKGAAQKRYERLLKSHGVTVTKSPTKASSTVADAEAEPSSPAGTSTSAAKKRRAPSTPGSNKKANVAKATAETPAAVKEEAEAMDIKEEEKNRNETEGSALSEPPEDLADPAEEC
ncbi:hypothetical protein K4F52_002527 [Lecanicillium sp. MT-2017a]|nr:hypothetical protein K4F52_002527 [Lecanicillium sp. MT-2017a]